MTGPVAGVYGGLRNVEDDDLIQGCVRWLTAQPSLMDLLGHYPGHVDEPYTPFLFQEFPYKNIEGIQGNSLVISYAGEWSGSNNYNRMSFPRLAFQFYCDPLRDTMQNIVDPAETRLRLIKIFKAFDLYMNFPLDPSLMFNSVGEGNIVKWGSIRVIGCSRISEPSITFPPDGDKMAMLETYYAVTTG